MLLICFKYTAIFTPTLEFLVRAKRIPFVDTTVSQKAYYSGADRTRHAIGTPSQQL